MKLNYDPTTGALRYDVATPNMAAGDRVIGMAIHRLEGDKPGPVIAQLLAPNQINGAGTLTMRGRNREDLVGGAVVRELVYKAVAARHAAAKHRAALRDASV